MGSRVQLLELGDLRLQVAERSLEGEPILDLAGGFGHAGLQSKASPAPRKTPPLGLAKNCRGSCPGGSASSPQRTGGFARRRNAVAAMTNYVLKARIP